MNGGDAAVAALLNCGVDIAFAVPGESYLPILAAMQRERNRMRLITPRHESGCTFAAEAYGKLTGKPAVALVSRGPGATNASIGVHTAAQDSSPLILMIGHVPTHSKGREAFQEVDFHQMFGSIAKAVLEPTSSAQVADVVARAVALSVAGRPGPVIVVMPKDITDGEAGEPRIPEPARRAVAAPTADDIAQAAELINKARFPVIIAGEMISQEDVRDELIDLAEACGAGVISAYRRQDTYPNSEPAYLGHLEINRAPFQEELWAECDLVIAAGARLDGISTQDFSMIREDQTLIHIFPDRDVLARWPSRIPIAADTGPTLSALAAAVAPPDAGRLSRRDQYHGQYLAFSKPGNVTIRGQVDLSRVVETVSRLAPAESVMLTDSGTFARWVHLFHRFERPHTQAGPMSGAMGYGVPGGIGAAMAKPDAPAIVFVGDGGFLMSGQELAAAAQHGLNVKVIVCDNNAWGSILVSQKTRYGDEGIHGTRLHSPDFAVLAQGYGLPSWRVEETEAFEAAFQAALAQDGPALVHLILDERDISPFNTDPKV